MPSYAATLLLALPLLAPALGHSIPRSPRGSHETQPQLDARALRDAATVMAIANKRAIPKGHFGKPPSSENLENSAGFKQIKRERLVRRRKSKRACQVKQSVAALPSTTSITHSSVLGAGLAVKPTRAANTTSAGTSTSGSTSSAITLSSAVTSTVPNSTSSTMPSSTTSAAPAPSTSSGGGDLMNYLFPAGRGVADWTTAEGQSGSLSFDAALKPLQAGHLPDASSAPDGSTAIEADFPAGTVRLASGQGFNFYTEGDVNGVSVTGAKEVTFSYSVFFQEGFQFNLGGKLPGLYGGTSYDTAKSCSGGRQDSRDQCFSARLMWRKNGMGEIYNYLPTAAYQYGNYCNTPPLSICNPQYGESIGRGAFTFPTGQWTTVAIRLKMNDANVPNGEQELFVNGQSVISLTQLMISANTDTKIYGIMAQTFFGGSDDTWASPIDQKAWFKDWSMAILA